jgi:hypothetical protein
MLRFLATVRQRLGLTRPAVFVEAGVQGVSDSNPFRLEPLAEMQVVAEEEISGTHYVNYDAFFAQDPLAKATGECGIRILRRNCPEEDARLFDNISTCRESLLMHFWPSAPMYGLAVLQALMGVRVDLVMWSASSVGDDHEPLPEGPWPYGGLDILDHAFPYPQEHHGAVSFAMQQAGHDFGDE